MILARLSLLSVLIGSAVLIAGPSVVAARDPGGDWSRIESGRIVVLSEAPTDRSERILERVRDFRADVFGAGRPFSCGETDTLKVFVFRDAGHLSEYVGMESADYRTGTDTNYLALSVDHWEAQLPSALALQAAHWIGESAPGAPPWIRSGLGAFYSTYERNGQSVTVGHRRPSSFKVLQGGKHLPWERVLEAGAFSEEVRDPRQGRMFAAQSWIVAHYLINETGEGEPGLARYVTYLQIESDPAKAFQQAFGISRQEFAQRAAAYSHSQSFDAIQFRPAHATNGSDPTVSHSALSGADLLVELGELTLAMNENRERADKLFQDALDERPDIASAHRGRGMAHLAAGEVSEAEVALRHAIELDPSDFHARFHLARTLIHPFQAGRIRFSIQRKDPPRAILDAREQLTRCLALDPKAGEVHIWLARTYLYDPGDPSPGIQTLERVQSLFPGHPDLAPTLALLHLRRGTVELAFPLLDPGDATDPARVHDRSVVVEQALRASGRARKSGDYDRVRTLIRALEERTSSWGMNREHLEVLESFEGYEHDTVHDGRRNSGRDQGDATSERQYAVYQEAVQLSHEKKYKKALNRLDELIAEVPYESIRASVVELHDQVSYNRALSFYERDRFQEALEMARALKKRTQNDGIRSVATALAKNCKQSLTLKP